MEITSSILLIGLLSLTAGALIGALAYRLLAPSVKQAEQARSELDAARDQMESYRDSVNEHFDKTAELVNELTQDYVRVYQHLAEGAQRLGDGRRFDKLLQQQPGKVAIAVDDDTVAAPARAGASVAGASVAPTASAAHAEAEADAADAGVEAAAETAHARGGALDERVAAETAEAGAATGDGESEASEATGAARRVAETREPVLNVDALDEAIEKTGRDDDAAAAVADGKREAEARTTTH